MHYNPQYDDKELLTEVAQGDSIAFTRLFNIYREKIYFFAWKLLRSESRAEDAVQVIFMKIWQNRDQLPEVQNFRAYLNTLTRNHIYNTLRRQAVEENYIRGLSSENTTVQSSAPDQLTLAELQRGLHVALSRLTPQQKRVFELSRLEGLRHAEIADQLGISSNTVRKHMTDALRLIRIHMPGQEKWAQLSILLFCLHL